MRTQLAPPGARFYSRTVSKRLYDCPQCGAPVPFQSSIAVFAVCEHCRSMVVPRGASAERLGEMAELPPDLSPLQIGTRGTWSGVAFELIGRLRVEWEEGSWTEWSAVFADGRTGWLAETQGFFTVSFAQDGHGSLPSPRELKAGTPLQIAERAFHVVDVKKVVHIVAEGELPFIAPPGSKRVSADLMASDGSFATIDSFPDSEPELYLGAYATFEALSFSNLRPVPGWNADVKQIRHATIALNCPICGAAVSLRASGLTMAAVCGSCASIIDTANPQARLIQEATDRIKQLKPILEIGTRGQLFGTEYEVIGLLQRGDQYSSWSEYLLFNPWQGFRWLVTYKGHWSFIDRLLETPLVAGRTARLRDRRTFRHFAAAETTVKAVLGEFFWKVQRGEVSHLDDYVNPPWILSAEKYPELEEVTWSLGQYVEPGLIATAFQLPKATKPDGVYLNQPNPHESRWRGLRVPALVFAVLALLLQMFFAARGTEKQVANAEFFFIRTAGDAQPVAVEADPTTDPARTFMIPEFELTGGHQPVAIELHAPVSNAWFGVEFSLLNTQTNDTFRSSATVEDYSGYQDGEYWTEGSQYATARIPSVPGGRYLLLLDPEADPQFDQRPFTVTVKRGGIYPANFFIALALVATYPLWTVMRRWAFESQRWSQSDHAPSSE